ncbi:hypothetical protein QP225_08995, partial [Aerococcus urinae]
LVADELDAAVHVFFVRGGRIRGTRGWVIDRVDGADEQVLMARLLEQVYSQLPPSDPSTPTRREKVKKKSVDDIAHTPTSAIPHEVFVSIEPDN